MLEKSSYVFNNLLHVHQLFNYHFCLYFIQAWVQFIFFVGYIRKGQI